MGREEVSEVKVLDESGVDTTVSTLLAMLLLFGVILLMVNVLMFGVALMTVRPALNLAAELTAQVGGGDIPVASLADPTMTATQFAQTQLEGLGFVTSVADVNCGFIDGGPVAQCTAQITPRSVGQIGLSEGQTPVFGGPITATSNGAISVYPSS